MTSPDPSVLPRKVVFCSSLVVVPSVPPTWVPLESGTYTWAQARERAIELAQAKLPAWDHPAAIGHLVVAQQIPWHLLDDTAAVIGRAGVRYRRRRQRVAPATWSWGVGTTLPAPNEEAKSVRAQILSHLPAEGWALRRNRKGAFPWFSFPTFCGFTRSPRALVERVVDALVADGLLERDGERRRWRVAPAMLLVTKDQT